MWIQNNNPKSSPPTGPSCTKTPWLSHQATQTCDRRNQSKELINLVTKSVISEDDIGEKACVTFISDRVIGDGNMWDKMTKVDLKSNTPSKVIHMKLADRRKTDIFCQNGRSCWNMTRHRAAGSYQRVRVLQRVTCTVCRQR